MSMNSQAPLPGVGPVTALRRALCKTFTYSGRASRSEYWWYTGIFAGSVAALVTRDVIAAGKERAGQLVNREDFDPEAFEKMTASEQRDYMRELQGDEPLKLSPATYALAGVLSLPYASLAVRRLHDSNISGKWMIPAEGLALAPFLYARASRPEGARFDRSVS